jgi:hypothetical protein
MWPLPNSVQRTLANKVFNTSRNPRGTTVHLSPSFGRPTCGSPSRVTPQAALQTSRAAPPAAFPSFGRPTGGFARPPRRRLRSTATQAASFDRPALGSAFDRPAGGSTFGPASGSSFGRPTGGSSLCHPAAAVPSPPSGDSSLCHPAGGPSFFCRPTGGPSFFGRPAGGPSFCRPAGCPTFLLPPRMGPFLPSAAPQGALPSFCRPAGGPLLFGIFCSESSKGWMVYTAEGDVRTVGFGGVLTRVAPSVLFGIFQKVIANLGGYMQVLTLSSRHARSPIHRRSCCRSLKAGCMLKYNTQW